MEPSAAPAPGPAPAPPPRPLRILSWNVNGLPAALKRLYGPAGTIYTFLADVGAAADVVCIQETKLRRAELAAAAHRLATADGWEAFFTCAASARGYSGTATFCRSATATPFAAELGFAGVSPEALSAGGAAPHPDIFRVPDDASEGDGFSLEELKDLDSEGRVTVTDHGAFILFNVYAPAVTSDDPAQAAERGRFKMRFFHALQRRWEGVVAAGRAVVVVGDLNVAPAPLDCPELRPEPEFYGPERPHRAWMRALLGNGAPPEGMPPPRATFIDCFRACHPAREGAFTVWNVATGARAHNYGARIDLTLASGLERVGAGCVLRLAGADISPEVQGSDHCPVWVDLALEAAGAGEAGGEDVAFPCAPTPPPAAVRFFAGKQAKLHGWLAAGTASKGEGSEARAAEVRPEPAAPAPPGKSGPSGPRQMSLKAFVTPKAVEPPPAPPAHVASPPSAPPPALSPGFMQAELAAAAAAAEQELAAAKGAWQAIQAKMATPRCGHGEAAALKKVGKAGPNHRRWFFMCARAKGAGPEAQCEFFKWVERRAGDAPRTTMGSGGAKRQRT